MTKSKKITDFSGKNQMSPIRYFVKTGSNSRFATASHRKKSHHNIILKARRNQEKFNQCQQLSARLIITIRHCNVTYLLPSEETHKHLPTWYSLCISRVFLLTSKLIIYWRKLPHRNSTHTYANIEIWSLWSGTLILSFLFALRTAFLSKGRERERERR